MKSKSLAVFASAAGLLVAAMPMSAHHSFSATYDSQKPAELRGAFVRAEWANPHTMFYFDVEDAAGQHESWAVEGINPSNLAQRKISKDTIKPGDVVVIAGYLAKNNLRRISPQYLLLSDGRKLFVGYQTTEGRFPL